ncbi:hypothetical protein CAMRE0001_0701 [Campylobacter rectus RM3267]|uniref:Uncharacterized protein n=1 Tax=Campylobacter rectus RM3267 TaxID=553218 RepID=B9CZL1_CAMRE|nr:hypothetical protein CAMRE0001_0701 [Campylobacter rectus RM3267]
MSCRYVWADGSQLPLPRTGPPFCAIAAPPCGPVTPPPLNFKILSARYSDRCMAQDISRNV